MHIQALLIAFSASVQYATGVPQNARRDDPALLERQAPVASTTSYVTSTLGYYSAGQESDVGIIWATVSGGIYIPYFTYYTSTGSLYGLCNGPYYISYFASLYPSSSVPSCALTATCSGGYLSYFNPSTSPVLCYTSGSRCLTNLLYSSYGATESPYSSFYCGWLSDTKVNAVSVYQKSPTITAFPSTSSSNSNPTATPNPASASTLPSSTSTSEPSGGGGKLNSNTGVIAGSVIGGVAVLGAIGVAVLYILKRSRRYEHTGPPPATPAPYQNQYQYVGPNDLPEKTVSPAPPVAYDPHLSGHYSQDMSMAGMGTIAGNGTGTPNITIPVPTYPEERNELSGVRSPAYGNQGYGAPPHFGGH
ncbi:hypothetical protein BCR34DRAFT_108114 [Clohesyomyces aquaticus]|uniref:Mid2 domain-containing protein n=1 Tax=Clohesyomyces aquaticus TaxID=1231657 RepID=A0A1Y1YRR0_9PLEO|nr:hypothetical protein BCR34DRAFT_108114 [Clohesyomyces aquaticus]